MKIQKINIANEVEETVNVNHSKSNLNVYKKRIRLPKLSSFLLLILTFVIAVYSIYSSSIPKTYHLKESDIASEDIYLNRPVVNEELTAEKIEKAIKEVKDVFKRDEEISLHNVGKIKNFILNYFNYRELLYRFNSKKHSFNDYQAEFVNNEGAKVNFKSSKFAEDSLTYADKATGTSDLNFVHNNTDTTLSSDAVSPNNKKETKESKETKEAKILFSAVDDEFFKNSQGLKFPSMSDVQWQELTYNLNDAAEEFLTFLKENNMDYVDKEELKKLLQLSPSVAKSFAISLMNNTQDLMEKQLDFAKLQQEIFKLSTIASDNSSLSYGDVYDISLSIMKKAMTVNSVYDENSTLLAKEAAAKNVRANPVLIEKGSKIITAGEIVSAKKIELLKSVGLLDDGQIDLMNLLASVILVLSLMISGILFLRYNRLSQLRKYRSSNASREALREAKIDNEAIAAGMEYVGINISDIRNKELSDSLNKKDNTSDFNVNKKWKKKEVINEAGKIRSFFNGLIGWDHRGVFINRNYNKNSNYFIENPVFKAEKKDYCLLLTLLICFLVSSYISMIVPYALPVLFVSVIVATYYSGREAIFYTMLLNLAIFPLTGFDYKFLFCSILACIVIAYMVHSGIRQNMYALIILLSALLPSLMSLCIDLMLKTSLENIFNHFIIYAFMGAFSAVIAVGAMPIYEIFLDSLSPLRMIELSNMNQALLRKLFNEATGTYHHSLMVAALSEVACEAIGANAMLVRVGALYHDIGKLSNPLMFTENQSDFNPHDEMEAEDSARIIISHVSEGLKLAESFGLPKQLYQFIEEHHGDTCLHIFYNKAVNKARENNLMPPDIADFTYKGLPPQSRETAVLMIADSVEAAMKSTGYRDLVKAEALMRSIIKSKFEHRQLDNSGLSFNDIELIIAAFLNVYEGQFHERVKYPDENTNK